jgi:hypothetical protein
LALAPSARAHVFEVYGQLNAGAGFGRGNAQAPAKDFFEAVQGPNAGGELGIEIMHVDLLVDRYEFFDSRLKGSWTQFMVGLDTDFPMDDDRTTLATIGVNAGLGTGSLESSNPPGQPTPRTAHQGAAAELRLSGDRLLGHYAAVGLDLRVGYHYLFDDRALPTDPDNHSQGIQLFGGLALKFHFSI